jgi:thioredoxin-disulfide reductase
MLYDLIIVGAGPAGLTAAIYSGRQQLKTLLLSKDLGGQTAKSHLLENYPGVPSVSGADLVQRIQEQVKALPTVECRLYSELISLTKEGEVFQLVLNNQEKLTAKSLVIAAGKEPRELQVPGEKELIGRGVTYCATCDGPLFKNKEVAVVGGGNSGLDAALMLAAYCPQVYLLEKLPELRGEQVRQEAARQNAKIKIITGAEVLALNGQQRLEKIRIKVAGQEQELAVAGLFVEIGYSPATGFVKDFLALNDYGEIVIDQKNQTSQTGVFAAGDITNVPYKQTVVAAGEGAKAALSAIEFILGRPAANY